MPKQRVNLRKAIQATGVLLREEPDVRMNYMRLLKVLYIAERESLKRWGEPLTRDRVVAMERGPVLSTVLDLIKDQHTLSQTWRRFFKTDHYSIEIVKNPGVGSLSADEVALLKEIAAENAQFDEWDMVRQTHAFPEWQDHEPDPGSCEDIPLRDILKAIGREADAEQIECDILAASEFDAMLSKLS